MSPRHIGVNSATVQKFWPRSLLGVAGFFQAIWEYKELHCPNLLPLLN